MRTTARTLLRLLLACLSALALTGLCVPHPAHADDQVVVKTDDSGPGSLRQAIADVYDGGTITFELTYPVTITLTSGELVIDKSLTLIGPGPGELIISGNDTSRVLNIVTGKVTLSGLTVAHGLATGAPALGGGILNAGALALQQVTVTANRSQADDGQVAGEAFGGGICNRGTLTITASTLSDNLALGGTADQFYSRGGGAFGAGVYHASGSGSLTIQASLLTNNTAQGGDSQGNGGEARGGAVHLALGAGACAIHNSEISTNTIQGGNTSGTQRDGGSTRGGGVYHASALQIENTSLDHNTAHGGEGARKGGNASGGGLFSDGTLTMADCTLDHNTARGGFGNLATSSALGGGLSVGLGQNASVKGSTLSNNVAKGGSKKGGPAGPAYGGGFYSGTEEGDASSLAFVNCTISSNVAGPGGTDRGGGGALGATTALVKLSFCTVAGNSAADSGGGLYSAATGEGAGPIIKNTIVASNQAPQGPDIYNNVQSRGWNLVQDTSDGNLDTLSGDNTAEGNIIGQDPGLGPLQANGGPPVGFAGPTWTHALLTWATPSPAIDAGSATDIDGHTVSVDQRGVPRPIPSGGRHDIGAYESPHRFFLPIVPRFSSE
jgi:hypothetical protein